MGVVNLRGGLAPLGALAPLTGLVALGASSRDPGPRGACPVPEDALRLAEDLRPAKDLRPAEDLGAAEALGPADALEPVDALEPAVLKPEEDLKLSEAL
ncbi:MAG: hypothetical protein LBR80_03855 [Deltaproteobacteria bacterium]|nr:hypothetical protein [Deltaproteobacteria bacterium]